MRTVLGVGVVLALTGCAKNPALPLLVEDGQTQRASLTGASSSQGGPLYFEVKRYPGGEPYSVASDRGSVVLLDVWATWCEPCRDALPLYEQIAKEYGSRGLKVYALNVDEDERAIPAFLAETKVALPILVDINAAVAEKTLKVRMMPTTFLVDRQGVVRFVHEGFAEEFLQKYQTEIEQLLAERAE
ncbi:TlpA disulfide reductase family protein [Stigmatella sp. ncwal1]|uniref:TlpA disulfide reductase family protein n=1 Tax=Stigmatella ashevillensis TaxID=2995309 RepID=A0ABT5DKV2_9BACT|nr:TlpA disulfide reductase family protein [Stigmatella ashevillena]MDC0714299.1 TlpA disulfide reductase family protein [Stigmatella ashevillena]